MYLLRQYVSARLDDLCLVKHLLFNVVLLLLFHLHLPELFLHYFVLVCVFYFMLSVFYDLESVFLDPQFVMMHHQVVVFNR